MTEQMNAMEAILTRGSCRKYKPDMVPKDLIDQIVKAGAAAPVGQGSNPPVIAVITDRSFRDRLMKINAEIQNNPNDPAYGAPVLILVLADRAKPTRQQDGSCVMENMMVAAHALGLGNCWINRARETFDRDDGKAILREMGIEGDLEGVGYVALGYADAEVKPKDHKNRIYYI